MAKKKRSKREQRYRDRLPDELNIRLQIVWSHLGHLIDWCQDSASWTDTFCSEARPYRETFYWESIAEMVSEYFEEHPGASRDLALADCLIATQSPACSDDSDRLVHFRTTWGQILTRCKEEIDAFTKADLELAKRDGIYEIVARLYASDHQEWEDVTDGSG
jgi:hypothetical protein